MKKIFRQVLKYILDKIGYTVFKNTSLPIGADVRKYIRETVGKESIKIIFDVGANVGQTSAYFNIIFDGSIIYSFEPISTTFKILKKNTRKIKNIKCYNFAFGERKGEETVYLKSKSVTNSLNPKVNKPQPRNANKSQMVTIATIDNFCESNNIKKVDILKIDTEGYDIQVLKGAEKILQKGGVLFIFIEVTFDDGNILNTQFNEVDIFLRKFNYRLVGLYNQSIHDGNSYMDYCNALYQLQPV